MGNTARIDKDKLKELVDSGASLNDMAVYFGVTSEGIRSAIRRNGWFKPKDIKNYRYKRGTWGNVKYQRIKKLNDSGVQELICAVIKQAFNEYVYSGESKLKPIENFFLSEWYDLMCSCLEYPVSGERILEQAMEKRTELRLKRKMGK